MTVGGSGRSMTSTEVSVQSGRTQGEPAPKGLRVHDRQINARRLLAASPHFAEREEPATAPDAKHPPATDPLRHGERDQLVIDGPADAGLDRRIAPPSRT